MLGRYEILTSYEHVDEAVEAIRGLQPEEIGTQLQPVQGYARVPLPFAYRNFAPFFAATIIKNGQQEANRDGTAFYSSRDELAPDIYDRLIADEDAAVEEAKQVGGLEIYIAGNPDERKSSVIPQAIIPFSFIPTNLSVCGWKSLEQARQGAATAQHTVAVGRAGDYYNASGIVKFEYHMEKRPTGIAVVYQGRSAREPGKVASPR